MEMDTDQHRRLIQEPRRDAAAIVFLVGLIALFTAPFVLARSCESPLLPLGLGAGPALLAASILIRSARTSAAAAAAVLGVALFLLELVIWFFVSLDHCPLQLGASTLP
jgi:hypothetical protein